MDQKGHLDSDLITTVEAAQFFRHRNRSTLDHWRSTGTGPAYYKVGRLVFYRRSDLSAYVESRRREPERGYANYDD